MEKLYKYGIVDEGIWEFINKHREHLDNEIINENDFNLGFFGIKTLEKSYLLKIKNTIVETPQFMLMRVSCGIHKGGPLSAVIETYQKMIQSIDTMNDQSANAIGRVG